MYRIFRRRNLYFLPLLSVFSDNSGTDFV